MSSSDLVLLFSTVGAAMIAGGVAYLTGRRTSKGTVQTSEASDLWKEGNEIRQWLTAEVSSLRKEVDELKVCVVDNETVIRQKEQKILMLEARLRSLGVTDGDT